MRNEDDDEEDERVFQRLQRKPAAAKSAAKPMRRRRDPFVNVPLWWGAAAAEAIRAPGVLVCLELLHRAWKVRSTTFSIPNGWLEKNGVSRKVKYRILRDLEAAKLIAIERRVGKSLRVTLVVT